MPPKASTKKDTKSNSKSTSKKATAKKDTKKPAAKKTSTKDTKKSTTAKKDTVKKEEKIPKFAKPGQKKETPPELDVLRMFYESYYLENSQSEMAAKWCVQHGLLPDKDAQKLIDTNFKLSNPNAGKSGVKTEISTGQKRKVAALDEPAVKEEKVEKKLKPSVPKASPKASPKAPSPKSSPRASPRASVQKSARKSRSLDDSDDE